jgi:hypothetical protein
VYTCGWRSLTRPSLFGNGSTVEFCEAHCEPNASNGFIWSQLTSLTVEFCEAHCEPNASNGFIWSQLTNALPFEAALSGLSAALLLLRKSLSEKLAKDDWVGCKAKKYAAPASPLSTTPIVNTGFDLNNEGFFLVIFMTSFDDNQAQQLPLFCAAVSCSVFFYKD